jgi:hypothetical protein
MSKALAVGRDSVLKKPVIAIKEDEKDKIKKAIELRGKQAKADKKH